MLLISRSYYFPGDARRMAGSFVWSFGVTKQGFSLPSSSRVLRKKNARWCEKKKKEKKRESGLSLHGLLEIKEKKNMGRK